MPRTETWSLDEDIRRVLMSAERICPRSVADARLWAMGIIRSPVEELNVLRKLVPERTREMLAAMPYDDFLRSAYWRSLSRYVRGRFQERCMKCGNREDLQVHHWNYDHRGSELLHLDDLGLFCRRCHAEFHDTWRLKPR